MSSGWWLSSGWRVGWYGEGEGGDMREGGGFVRGFIDGPGEGFFLGLVSSIPFL